MRALLSAPANPLKTRGDRVRHIRVSLDMTGDRFADHLNEVTRRLGFEPYWEKYKVSSIENDRRDTSPMDLAVLACVDPEERGWFWIAFGRPHPTIGAVRAKPVPKVGPKGRRRNRRRFGG